MAAIQATLGFLTLLAGRQYYVLFVGAAVFMLSGKLIPEIVPEQSQINILWMSLVAGLVGAYMTFSLKRLLALLVSFYVGGTLIYGFWDFLSLDPTQRSWLVFIIAGTVCVFLSLFAFDFTIMILSALFGAWLIAQNLPFPGLSSLVWVVVLAGFGILVQLVLMQYGHPEPD